MKKILVIGAGAMGSAFTIPCIDNQNSVVLIGTHLEDETVDKIIKNNYLHPSLQCRLPRNLKIQKFENFSEEFKKKPDLIVIAVSSKGIDWVGNEISKHYSEEIPILLITKGLAVVNNQFVTLPEKLKIILKKNGFSKINISAVKGPCLAVGLANKIRTSAILANTNISIAKSLGKLISTSYYSTEFSNDIIGVEVCAAIKNIYSMIIGASRGLSSTSAISEIKNKHYLNTAASLIHRSISEMVYFTNFLKGKKETVYGLAGLGDLYVSAIGGRNSKMGKYLGEGYGYEKAIKTCLLNNAFVSDRF